MQWCWGRRASRAAWRFTVVPGLFVGAALVLAGCNTDNGAAVAAAQPRGATVAFESIDGPPQGQFNTLVRDLNDEAQQRRLAVLSREQASAYRVRGYLAAEVDQGATTISWVWDVFDRNQRRTLRIGGSEVAKAADGWQAADNAMLQRIARSSMAQLAAFLTSPEAAPAASAPAGPQIALSGPPDSSPEAAGIFRIFQAHADPVSEPAARPIPTARQEVPLPPHRPADRVAAGATLRLAAAALR